MDRIEYYKNSLPRDELTSGRAALVEMRRRAASCSPRCWHRKQWTKISAGSGFGRSNLAQAYPSSGHPTRSDSLEPRPPTWWSACPDSSRGSVRGGLGCRELRLPRPPRRGRDLPRSDFSSIERAEHRCASEARLHVRRILRPVRLLVTGVPWDRAGGDRCRTLAAISPGSAGAPRDCRISRPRGTPALVPMAMAVAPKVSRVTMPHGSGNRCRRRPSAAWGTITSAAFVRPADAVAERRVGATSRPMSADIAGQKKRGAGESRPRV